MALQLKLDKKGLLLLLNLNFVELSCRIFFANVRTSLQSVHIVILSSPTGQDK